MNTVSTTTTTPSQKGSITKVTYIQTPPGVITLISPHLDQLVDPYTYVYNKPVFSKDGEAPVYYKNAYQTDVVHAKGLEALKKHRHSDKPFFLWIAPMAPHGQFKMGDNGSMTTEPPVPAARHAHLFKDVKSK
jgi:hypothetical protein